MALRVCIGGPKAGEVVDGYDERETWVYAVPEEAGVRPYTPSQATVTMQTVRYRRFQWYGPPHGQVTHEAWIAEDIQDFEVLDVLLQGYLAFHAQRKGQG